MIKNKISTSGLINLLQPRLGTKIVYKTDEFFGLAERILSQNSPMWKEGLYDKNGKWMDGWETRRKREKGNDYLIISLGKPGKIKMIDIDTSYFNGNQPEYTSIEGCYSENFDINKNISWKTILKKSKVKPNFQNMFITNDKKSYTHIRFNIFPDGGVARLRLYGIIDIDKSLIDSNDLIELSSIINGSSVIAVNNEHFGKAENILAPGKSFNMSDGWETRRRRNKGNDWLIFKFGVPGYIKRIVIDTSHFKGNYPDYFDLQASYINNSKNISKNLIVKNSIKWKYLIKKTKLYMHQEHTINNNLLSNKLINYIRINIFPDGGISRINIFGNIKN